MAHKPLISIVDDDAAFRNATKGLARALGFAAEAFESAVEFLKFGQLHDTACLIADVQIPQMSGLDLHYQLVASGVSIPTILMTAYASDRMQALAVEIGVVCILTKPFGKDTLLGCINSALDRGQAQTV
jgi:FixJ family two-component response regulator